MDRIDGKNIRDEAITAAVAVGSSVTGHLSNVSGIDVVWSG